MSCRDCPKGWWQNEENKLECKGCPNGSTFKECAERHFSYMLPYDFPVLIFLCSRFCIFLPRQDTTPKQRELRRCTASIVQHIGMGHNRARATASNATWEVIGALGLIHVRNALKGIGTTTILQVPTRPRHQPSVQSVPKDGIKMRKRSLLASNAPREARLGTLLQHIHLCYVCKLTIGRAACRT